MRLVTADTAVSKRKANSMSRYLVGNWQLYIMLIPCVILLFVFNYLPIYGIVLAFKDYNPLLGFMGSQWVGLEHFQKLFEDPNFFIVVTNTIKISLLKILFGFPVPIVLALLMNEMRKMIFKRSVQTLIYLPHFISWVVIAGILFDILSVENGVINMALQFFGIETIDFYANDRWFIFTIIASDVWKSAGWGTIIYFAALSGISPELYEAAEMDGAKRWHKIKYITLPGIMPAVTICAIFSLSGIMYAGFDQVYNMYNPLVYDVADIIDTYVYRIGITSGKYGMATALGLFNSVIGFILIVVSNNLIKRAGGVGVW